MTEKHWQFYTAATAVIAVLVSVYCLSENITGIFVHLYYIPILIASYQYRERGLLLSLFLVMVYLLIVVITAVYLGRGPAILASFLSVLAFDFFFILPFFTFAVSDTQYIITFIALFLVGLVISQLTVRAREQAEAAQQAQPEAADPAAAGVSARESSVRQQYLERKAAMKKKKRDVMGLWD